MSSEFIGLPELFLEKNADTVDKTWEVTQLR